ncbi:MAG: hypothetical protein EBT55_01040 [Proteobacteria bacterium]|nr:hypothetical protein [Pseudomonadota bacterium]
MKAKNFQRHLFLCFFRRLKLVLLYHLQQCGQPVRQLLQVLEHPQYQIDWAGLLQIFQEEKAIQLK